MRIQLTENIELREQIQQALKDNGGHCPCRLEKTENTKCMCKEFREQESGPCHCGLYIKTEK